MQRISLGQLNNDFLNTDVLAFENMNRGFSVQVSGRNLTGSVTVFVLASNGANSGGVPSIADVDDWYVIDSLAMAGGSSFFTQGDFWGKYIYVLIDATGVGTLDDVVVYFNKK